MRFKLLVSLASVALLAAGCGPDFDFSAGEAEILELSANALNFTSDGGTQTITLSSTAAYNAFLESDWAELNCKENAFDVTVAPNAGYNYRDAFITVSSGGLVRTVAVRQDAFVIDFVIGTHQLDFEAAGGTQTVSCSSNVAFETAAPDWIAVRRSADGLSVSVENNGSYSAREGDIVFSYQGEILDRLAVAQAGKVKEPPIEIEMVFSTGSKAYADVTTPALFSSASMGINLGPVTRTLTARPDYEMEFYSRGMTLVVNTSNGLRVMPDPKSYDTSNQLRAETFAYIKFPPIEGRKLTKMAINAKAAAAEICIGTAMGPDNAAAKASSVTGGIGSLKAGANEFVLTGSQPDTPYYLLMFAGNGVVYNFLSFTLYYEIAE